MENYLNAGDDYIKKGDFDKAKDSYLDARKLATQLASFYSDLNTSFKGVDARIPKEMQKKGKEILQILAISNERLSAPSSSRFTKASTPDLAVRTITEQPNCCASLMAVFCSSISALTKRSGDCSLQRSTASAAVPTAAAK